MDEHLYNYLRGRQSVKSLLRLLSTPSAHDFDKVEVLYTEEEKIASMQQKNPALKDFIKQFDLTL